MDVFERDVTVAAPVLGSMEFYLTVDPPSALAFEGEVAFRTETVSRSDAVVFKDIQALTELTTTIAFANGKVVLSHWRVPATTSADMRRKVPSRSSMFFQINRMRIGAATETFKKIG
ncbi:hypothetical protein AA0113_g12504 [Alternaria arborescens]|jgi:hypothetical protein|uniref:Uncharacterized protein n=4 Tax=Alternaria sect. Alternaria TaxID=2499237 RepID=A0A4Q4MZB8_ALTAL|nr:hypothetical protein AA0115_g12942 [Alternaria tenuissima]RYN62347.1 hypothetical protein AA0117_g12932 [Alternaria alternata]RYO02869.1 hypothetical protein AA0121_g13199 [Alternaria tenuissima]RYO26412.1 hypothetical protein AA0113_g12504 [Alternaria arborescens]RYO48336.1 hypothetical protein AA0116_g12763 [Alternaria tenuissima]